MTKAFLGEYVITIRSLRLTIRPSFAALYAIEGFAGCTIARVIAVLQSPACHAALIRAVIEQGMIACYGTLPRLPRLRQREWMALREDATSFLIIGLGYQLNANETVSNAAMLLQQLPVQANASDAPSTTSQRTNSAPSTAWDKLDWSSLYKTAVGLLGKSEAEFWQMTMCGLMLQSEAYAASQGFDMVGVGLPATHDDLTMLMAQFPDASGEA